MGWFSKLKKKAKKLKLKDVGKALAKGVEKTAELAKNLPAPVGTVGRIVDKGFDIAEKIENKKDKIKAKLSPSNAVSNALGMVNKKSSSRSSRAVEGEIPMVNPNRRSRREVARMKAEARRNKRRAIARAKRDGFRAYR